MESYDIYKDGTYWGTTEAKTWWKALYHSIPLRGVSEDWIFRVEGKWAICVATPGEYSYWEIKKPRRSEALSSN